MVAAYTVTGDSFVSDKPRLISETRIANSGPAGTNYDVGPDGKRIAALMPVDAPEGRQAQHAQGWTIPPQWREVGRSRCRGSLRAALFNWRVLTTPVVVVGRHFPGKFAA
jgi:hypothetical protein